jgi:hypothetical protein
MINHDFRSFYYGGLDEARTRDLRLDRAEDFSEGVPGITSFGILIHRKETV